jgi:MSHA biogenesis protein MshJ
MKQWWEQYQTWFAGRTRREQQIVAVSVLFLLLYPVFWFAILPALEKTSVLNAQAKQQRSTAAMLQAQLLAQQSTARDPDAATRGRLADLRKQIALQEPRFKAVGETVVPADKVALLLERLLAGHGGLQLLSLKSMPPVALVQRKEHAAAGVVETNVYRHGVEVKLVGGYANLLRYLDELEHSSQRVLWSRLSLDAADHRQIVMTLTVNTLSLDKAWLAL